MITSKWFQAKAVIIPASLIVLGILTVGYGLRFPEYYDPNWEAPFHEPNWSTRLHTAFDEATRSRPAAFDAMANEWGAAKAKAETPRDVCLDRGAGVILLGLSIWILFMVKGVSRIRDLAGLTTPKTQQRFYVLATIAWLSFIPAEWAYYMYTDDRGDYPWFGDIIAIPCFGILIFGIIGLPFVLFGVKAALGRAQLPLAVFSRPVLSRFYIVSIALWIAAILALLVTAFGVAEQPPIVPSGLFTLYLILSGRAAAVHRPIDATCGMDDQIAPKLA